MQKRKKKSQFWDWCNDLHMGPVSMKKIYCVPGEHVRMGQLRFLLPAVAGPMDAGVIKGLVNPLGAEMVGICQLNSSWLSHAIPRVAFLLNPPYKIFSSQNCHSFLAGDFFTAEISIRVNFAHNSSQENYLWIV